MGFEPYKAMLLFNKLSLSLPPPASPPLSKRERWFVGKLREATQSGGVADEVAVNSELHAQAKTQKAWE